MKKLLTLFALTFIFFSCSSEEDLFEGSQSDLTGTWKVSKVIVEGIQIELNACDRKEEIIVSSSGNANWNYYLTDSEPCSKLTNNFTFKSANINFEIEGTSQNTSMYGKFQGANQIQITKIYRDPSLTTVYTFKK